MKKLIITLIAIFNIAMIYAQAPGAFNYQTIVRNSNGDIIADQSIKVRIRILQTNESGSIVYSETHSPTTNTYGLINLNIGQGTVTYGTTLNDIAWADDDYFLQIEVDLTGGDDFTMVGVSQLLSVPYALSAGSGNGGQWQVANNDIYRSEGNVGIGTSTPMGKLEIVGEAAALPEDPLFEVKNKDDQVIFGVYNEGVRVYVDDSGGKGTRGGFAVGGFSTGKGPTNEYLRVTPDSVRIYVEDAAKGTRGGFAVGGFSTGKGLTDEYLSVTPDSVRVYIEDGAKGTRGGFAVGGFSTGKGLTNDYLNVTPDSVRVYINEEIGKGTRGGFAVGGFSTGKASNSEYFSISTTTSADIIDPSEARVVWYPKKEAFLTGRVLIEDPDSVGTNSMASGFESIASGDFSQAFGYQAYSSGKNSTAIGNYSQATGANSFAFGDSAFAFADDAYAIGAHTLANGKGAMALGSFARDMVDNVQWNTIASGNNSLAIGVGTTASGDNAYAIGDEATATGNWSMSLGGGIASGLFGITLGGGYAEGDGSLVLGSGTAYGYGTLVSGYSCTAYGWNSKAIGYKAKANGNYSIALGYEVIAQARYSLAVGIYNLDNSDTNSILSSDPIFTVGNGSFSSRHNALKIQRDGSVFLPDIADDAVSGGGYVYINSTTGQIGLFSSSARFKENITDIEDISWIYDLRPVNFNYINDETKSKYYGLIAEEVVEVNPALVTYDKDGQLFSVSYEKLFSPLVKTVQEHKGYIELIMDRNDALEKENADLKRRIEKLEETQQEILKRLD